MFDKKIVEVEYSTKNQNIHVRFLIIKFLIRAEL
jgi:hypothetical protein